MKIGRHEVGAGHPCIVIAESGLNANGSPERALGMVRAAAKAGAHAFKVQIYTAEEFCGPDETYTYLERDEKAQASFRRVTERQIDMFKRCELSMEALRAVRNECRTLGIAFVATVTDERSIMAAVALGTDAFKVGSDDLTHTPLLRRLAGFKNIPTILSTGMASAVDIAEACRVLTPAVLLHCVSRYPTPPESANILRMAALYSHGVLMGFSDHTEGTVAAMVAAAMGASVIEKHFTLDRKLPGPDHWFSVDPEGLASLVNMVGGVRMVRGTGQVDPTPEELEMRIVARRSVVAAVDIPVGALIAPEMLAYRRPGSGLPPSSADLLIGQRVAQAFKAGEQIDADHLAAPQLEKLH